MLAEVAGCPSTTLIQSEISWIVFKRCEIIWTLPYNFGMVKSSIQTFLLYTQRMWTCTWHIHSWSWVPSGDQYSLFNTFLFYIKISLCSWPWCVLWDRVLWRVDSQSLYEHSWSECFPLLTSTPAGLWTLSPPSTSRWNKTWKATVNSKWGV